jgi:glutamate/tyrosine decarboxylase-like PLP-dependent enzyme
MEVGAAYLMRTEGAERDPMGWNPEFSRRARGFAALWAAIRSLGRSGIAEIVDRCCVLARRFADALAAVKGVTIMNDVV